MVSPFIVIRLVPDVPPDMAVLYNVSKSVPVKSTETEPSPVILLKMSLKLLQILKKFGQHLTVISSSLKINGNWDRIELSHRYFKDSCSLLSVSITPKLSIDDLSNPETVIMVLKDDVLMTWYPYLELFLEVSKMDRIRCYSL